MSTRDVAEDALKAAAWFAFGVVLLLVVPRAGITWWPGEPPAPLWTGVAALAVAGVGEIGRRRLPLAGLVLGTAAFLAGPFLTGESSAGIIFMFCDLLYCAVLHSGRRVSLGVCVTVGGTAAALAALSLVRQGPQAAVAELLNLALLAVPVLWGREVRHHREQTDAERHRAEQAERVAELDRAAAVAAERARMARDLHDVIAGQLSGIAIQSEAALTITGADEALLRRVLTDVRRDSVASLAEMRTMIGLLRADGATEPRTAPAGLDRLGSLVDAGRSAGLTIEIDDRRPAALPAAVDLAAFRIVQESLTNAAKHAPGSTVRLVLRQEEGSLVVELENDLVPDAAPAGGTGTGLLGLRERAAALGGSVDAGARDRTWTVHARLPAVAAP